MKQQSLVINMTSWSKILGLMHNGASPDLCFGQHRIVPHNFYLSMKKMLSKMQLEQQHLSTLERSINLKMSLTFSSPIDVAMQMALVLSALPLFPRK